MAEERKFPEEADTVEMPKPLDAEPRRTRIPLWEALGTEEQLREGEMVWVLFSDAIVRVRLEGPWVVSRRGPRPLSHLVESCELGKQIDLAEAAMRPELLVLTRDGVVALRHGEGTRIEFASDIVTGEHVEPVDDPEHTRCYVDIVRVTR